jgi:hypothetical protein
LNTLLLVEVVEVVWIWVAAVVEEESLPEQQY